jgi:hypothetical protein
MNHWLKHGDHGGSGATEMTPPVAALIDPDEMFLRPLTTALGNASNLLFSPPVKIGDLLAPFDAPGPSRPSPGEQSWRVVGHGFPAGQFYGIGDQWIKFNRTNICGKDSPCVSTSVGHAWRYYTVGPPYILHYHDWMKLAPSWADFVPRVFDEYPQLLAEM